MAAIENLVRYADLRLLIDINAPEFDYDAAVGSASRERASAKHQATSSSAVSSDLHPDQLETNESRMRNKGLGKGRSSSQQADGKAKSRTEKKNSSRSGGASDGHLEDNVATTHLSSLNDIYNEDNWKSVPEAELESTFAHYRHMTKQRLSELEQEVVEVTKRLEKKMSSARTYYAQEKEKWAAKVLSMEKALGRTPQAATVTPHQLSNAELADEGRDEQLAADSEDVLEHTELTRDGPIEDDVQLGTDNVLSPAADARVDDRPLSGGGDLMTGEMLTGDEVSATMTGDEGLAAVTGVLLPTLPLHPTESETSIGMGHTLDKSTSVTLARATDNEPTVVADPSVLEQCKYTSQLVFAFKENLARLFMDQGMTSLADTLMDIDDLTIKSTEDISQQIVNINKRICSVLQQCFGLINRVLSAEQNYQVSSSLSLASGRRVTGEVDSTPLAQPSSATVTAQPFSATITGDHSNNVTVSAPSSADTASRLRLFEEHCRALQTQLQMERKGYEQQRGNTMVVMTDMQQTIVTLQSEVATLKTQLDTLSQQQSLSATDQQLQEAAKEDAFAMFTSLDAERNARILKQALFEKRLDDYRYERAVEAMEQYTSLPVQRWENLVRRYLRHCRLREVEKYLYERHTLSDADNVVALLARVESLEDKQAEQWSEIARSVSTHRQQLASELTDTLAAIEAESDIFLIKPLLSYKNLHANLGEKIDRKTSRPFTKRARVKGELVGSTTAQLNTPANNNLRLIHQSTSARSGVKSPGIHQSPRALVVDSGAPGGVVGMPALTSTQYNKPLWNPVLSEPSVGTRLSPIVDNAMNTPHILQLDINRLMIGQNLVSLKVAPHVVSDDRLVNAAGTSTRSLLAVTRPGQQVYSNYLPEQQPPPTRASVKTQSVMEAGHKPDTPATHHKPDTPASASTYDSLATMYNNVNNVVFPPTPPLPPIAADAPNS